MKVMPMKRYAKERSSHQVERLWRQVYHLGTCEHRRMDLNFVRLTGQVGFIPTWAEHLAS